ncbi:MAG: MFS transporter [Prevotella sp.]|nr:MFS transporter [Prevotella sp.]
MNSHKLTVKEKVGYSLGDAAANLVFQMMLMFQLMFYTDVFGLEGLVAGTVLLIARVADAFVDPAVGILSDKTKTRWGKYRPWILWSVVPFCLFYVLAFWNPGIENKSLVAIYATLSYVLLMSSYSLINTPYCSLGGVMTSDIEERTSLNTYRFIAVTIGQIIVQGATLPLVDTLGGDDRQQGWLWTVAIFAVISFLCLLTTFRTTRERVTPPPMQNTDLREDLRDTMSNASWKAIIILTFFLFITLSMWNSAMNFYFRYDVDQKALADFLGCFGMNVDQQHAYSVGFSVFNISAALVQLVAIIGMSERLARRYGKKEVVVFCLLLTAVLTALYWIPTKTDVTFLFVLNILRSMAYAPTIPLLWAMMGDVADNVEYLSNRRSTGLCFSSMTFSLKVGLGIGGVLTGFILSAFGYVSGDVLVQNEMAETGIRLTASLIPALSMVVGVWALSKSPITKMYNEKMQSELSGRRWIQTLTNRKQHREQ